MIVFKIYNLNNFEETHRDFFHQLLDVLSKANYLSPTIDEIIITDDLPGEIARYSQNRFLSPNLTQSREFKAIAKTVDYNGKKKVFFDAYEVNAHFKHGLQIFFEQLIEVYAEDLVSYNYKVPTQFTVETSLTDIIKIFFSPWATKVVSNVAEEILSLQQENFFSDVKMFVDSFKRNIRKLHYNYQKDVALEEFWIKAIKEVDFFIRRCFDVKYDEGSFEGLQEFVEIIPPLLTEIEIQAKKLLQKETVDFSNIRKWVLSILNKCSIDIPYESKMHIKITDTPKNLFKNNLVDTEPRIVAFMDILGFSSIIEEYDLDEHSNILNELHDTLEMAIKVSIEQMTNQKAKTDLKEYLEYRMFSDCISLSLPYIEFSNDFHVQFQSISTIARSY